MWGYWIGEAKSNGHRVEGQSKRSKPKDIKTMFAVWAEDAEVLAVHMCSVTGNSEGRIIFRLK